MDHLSLVFLKDDFLSEARELISQYPEIFADIDIKVYHEKLTKYLIDAPHRDHERIIVAEKDGHVYGVICLEKPEQSADYYRVSWLVVKKDFQGQGIGTKLMEEAFHLVRGFGGKDIILETSYEKYNKATQHFYEKMGFKKAVVLPDFYQPTIQEGRHVDDCVIYRKEL